MIFPTLVYRTPGQHHASTGTYDYRAVNSAEELEEAKSCGWFSTLQGAIDGEEEEQEELEGKEPAALILTDDQIINKWLSDKLAAVEIEHDEDMTADELLFVICHEFAKVAEGDDPVDPEETGKNSEPTREELEAKATELNIAFDGRTTNRILAEKIDQALAAQE